MIQVDRILPEHFDGVHRVTFVADRAFDDGERIAGLALAHIDAARRASLGHPSAQLHCDGWESSGAEVILWLSGSVTNWAGLQAMSVPIAPFEAAEAEAQRQGANLREIRLEHRPAGQPLRADQPGGGPPGTQTSIDGIRVDDTVSPAQLDALARLFEDVAVRHHSVRSSTLRGPRTLFFEIPFDAEIYVEVTQAWATAFWADPAAVDSVTGPTLDRERFVSNIDWEVRPEHSLAAVRLVKEFLRRSGIGTRSELDQMLYAATRSGDAPDARVLETLTPTASSLPSLTTALLSAALASDPSIPDRFAPVLVALSLVGPIWLTELGEIQVGVAGVPLRSVRSDSTSMS